MRSLPYALRLPLRYRHVPEYLASFDGDLRIRRSVERPDLFILERRVRRAPTANLGMSDASDLHIQARDGFIHISTVHPQWLERPWAMVEALTMSGADLWDHGGASKFADELEYEETWLKETRRRRRRQLFREIALEGYDLLNRIGSKRTRITSPGFRDYGGGDPRGV